MAHARTEFARQLSVWTAHSKFHHSPSSSYGEETCEWTTRLSYYEFNLYTLCKDVRSDVALLA
jgi:hypothetical protein